ncbi:molybdopterin synthase sulfur carrier subunit [Vibrio rumoiensis]|uniref:Molybdopterin synthase sulfur carrier subunit n=1 Tax=Vibrio rumoiensis 1S-45 TaxID=1188252 RepID=A0A1E5E0P5_9VIBR|nr:molybdopterin synthase sulfur carrier subunit [Vibrio rumoiensis]OEF23786.1 molybdopterin synthase sulfur carrier subunit [Vibrio rumoiensis 1S-45]
MIKVLFFAQTREQVGVDFVMVDADNISADTLREQLCEKGNEWSQALQSGKLLVAINQDMVQMDTVVKSGDEVAFFPPVTGG